MYRIGSCQTPFFAGCYSDQLHIMEYHHGPMSAFRMAMLLQFWPLKQTSDLCTFKTPKVLEFRIPYLSNQFQDVFFTCQKTNGATAAMAIMAGRQKPLGCTWHGHVKCCSAPVAETSEPNPCTHPVAQPFWHVDLWRRFQTSREIKQQKWCNNTKPLKMVIDI